jgi:hypothetical protein
MSVVIEEAYYLESPYLEEPYLLGTIAQADGLQFESNNAITEACYLEYPYLEDSYLYCVFAGVPAIQFNVQNFQAANSGVQFNGLNTGGLKYVGVEFRASSSWTMYQCGGGICATGGLQFLVVNGVNKGIQFRVVNYNTTNLRILYQFPSRGTSGTNWTASLTASSSTNAFTVDNVNTDIVEQVWRSGPATGATLTCDTEVTQGIYLDTLAILNHNFGGNTSVVLERSTNGSTWTTEATLTVERENMYYIAPTLSNTAYRYWRLVLSDSSLSSVGFQVGTIVFGAALTFTNECFVDEVRFGRKQFSDKVFTEGHTNVANDRGKKKNLELDFRNLNYSGSNFSPLRDAFDVVGTILKSLWIPTPQTPSRFAVFGKLEEIPTETHNTKGDDYVSLSIKVDESL